MPDIIARIETYPLLGRAAEGPWGPPYGFVVKVTTSDGITGYGESDTMPSIARMAIEAPFLNPLVTGLRALLFGTSATPADAWRLMRHAVVQYGRDGVVLHAMAAIDIALWDIAGKRAGKPVSALIGGAKRERLRCYGTHPLGETLAETAANARRVVELGFGALKFGWHPLGPDAKRDEAIVRTLRGAAGPDVDLMIDAGMAWDVTAAIDRAERFRPYGLFWLEEPLAAYDIEGYAQLRKAADIPIAAGEMAASAAELSRLASGGCVDILQIDVSRTGLTQALDIAATAAKHGIPIINHTYSYILNAAASAHLMAVASDVSLFECQTTGNEIREALNAGQLTPREGWITVPASPGLGVEIDDAALAYFSQASSKVGYS